MVNFEGRMPAYKQVVRIQGNDSQRSSRTEFKEITQEEKCQGRIPTYKKVIETQGSTFWLSFKAEFPHTRELINLTSGQI